MEWQARFAWQCAFGWWRRQRNVARCLGELKPKPKREVRAESFLSYRWTLGPPTVLLPCKYTLSSVNEECYLLVHPSQWLIFQRNFQIGQLFKEGQQKVPKRLFRTWWPGVVFRALSLRVLVRTAANIIEILASSRFIALPHSFASSKLEIFCRFLSDDCFYFDHYQFFL